MNSRHKCTALILALVVGLPAGCASLREEVKMVKDQQLTKAAQGIAAPEPKALWQTVMHAQEADYIGFIGPDRILVSEQELLGAGLILELEAAVPACGAVCLYDAATGSKIWTYQRKKPKQYSLVATTPSLVLMGIEASEVAFIGLDPDTGTVRWEKAFGGGAVGALSPGADVITVATVGRFSSRLTALSLSDGSIAWQRNVKDLKLSDGSPPKLITLKDGMLVLGRKIRLVSHQTGDDIWEIESPFGEQRIISAEAQQERLVIFSSSRAELFDLSSGKGLWTFKAGDRAIKSALFEKDAIFFHTRLSGEKGVQDAVTAAKIQDGSQIWTHNAGSAIRSPLLSYKGRLYYTDDRGVAALSLRGGKLAFKSVVPGDFNIAQAIEFDSRFRDISLPDLILVYGKHVVVARETYGVVAVVPETGKVAFAHTIPIGWTGDYTFAVRRSVLNDKIRHFAQLRHEKNADERIEKVNADSHHASDTFGSSVQHLAAASTSSAQFERLTGVTQSDGGRKVGGMAVSSSREAVALMGAQKAAIETRIAMDRMMANIQFWNAVTGSFFGAIEAAQAGMQQANLSKAQLELNHAQTLHWQSLQHGFYIRPYKLELERVALGRTPYAHGVTLVDLETGRRSDFLFGVTDYDLTEHGLELPTFAVSIDRKLIITDAIGLDSSRYEKYELGRYDMPYPFLLAYSVPSLSFKKSPSIANPDLVKAAGRGSMDTVRRLIAADPKKATLKKYGTEALVEASYWKHLDVARFLVDQGVDLNAKGGSYTPLESAADKGHKELVRYLIKKGANVNRCACLLQAVNGGHLEIVRILIAAGADVNHPEYYKYYSLLTAAKMKKDFCKAPCDKPYDEIIDLLVKSGAQ